jgi:hypothetical protein
MDGNLAEENAHKAKPPVFAFREGWRLGNFDVVSRFNLFRAKRQAGEPSP